MEKEVFKLLGDGLQNKSILRLQNYAMNDKMYAVFMVRKTCCRFFMEIDNEENLVVPNKDDFIELLAKFYIPEVCLSVEKDKKEKSKLATLLRDGLKGFMVS